MERFLSGHCIFRTVSGARLIRLGVKTTVFNTYPLMFCERALDLSTARLLLRRAVDKSTARSLPYIYHI